MTKTHTVLLISDDTAGSAHCGEVLADEFVIQRGAPRGGVHLDPVDALADLVILEIRNGSFDVSRLLRSVNPPTRVQPVPIIVVTANHSSDSEARLLAEGADDVLRAPVDAAVLKARVRRCLERVFPTAQSERFAEYRALIRQLAISFISTYADDADPGTDAALQMIGRFLHADRAYVFAYHHDSRSTSNTHEWCADGIVPQVESLQGIPMDAVPEWVGPHSAGRSLIIESVPDLPSGNLREILMPQGINSLIAVPLMDGSDCQGFVGIDIVGRSQTFGAEEHEMLLFFAQLLVSVNRRRRVDATLRKLSLAVEQSSEAIIITDVAGSIEYVNDTFVRQTGFDRSEVMGRTPSMLASGKTAPQTYEQMWRALRAGKAWKGQFLNRHKQGHEYYVFSIITPLSNSKREITHFVAVNEDVTEKKRIGQELDRHRHQLEELVEQRTSDLQLAKEVAEQANRAKSEFLANMSHELRTPLNSVLGMSEVLQMGDVYGPLNDRQFNALEQIRESGQHLLKLISEILDLARIEAGKFTLDLQSVDVSKAAVGALRLMEQTAHAKTIQLDYRQGLEAQGASMVADEQRVRQILFNLLGNAIKFTPSGGSVSLQVRLDRAAERVCFAVSDTGEGIPLEAQTRLFQPFTQFETTTTKRHAGSGLGLSIVKRLMDMHGGEVTVRSVVGEGSVFTVHFPWKAPDRVTAPAMVASPYSAMHKTVLIVEDNAMNVVPLRDYLEANGYAVDVATDGTQALARAAKREYDAILMDLQMPEMDGLEATRQLRRIPGHDATPIIALTSFATPGDRERCLAAGMNHYMPKPISFRALGELLKTAVQRPK
ncbi:MAG: response regulator [Sinobacteraceae bacterium]|nr:response regulator [Nevskiaceae bacterium]